MKRFSDEVLLHSQQRHPNIVQLMGVYYPPCSQLPMLIMEYLPFTLTQCLESKEIKLSLQMKYSILLDVAKGVCYLHGKRPPIVHRDLTANNVLLTSSYTAKISDLGVSRLVDTFKKQQLTTAPGNDMVMPPEALEDTPVYDHKLDVFSYGCLILHVLTNEFPEPTKQFIPEKGESYKKISEWDRRVKHIRQIPKENELLPLAKQCLNDDPADRPEMTESYQCLKEALSKYPKLKTMIELTQENEEVTKENEEVTKENEKVTKERRAAERQLHELTAKHNILKADITSKEREILDITEKFDKEKEAFATVQREREQEMSKLKQENNELRIQLSKAKEEENRAKIAKMNENREDNVSKKKDQGASIFTFILILLLFFTHTSRNRGK